MKKTRTLCAFILLLLVIGSVCQPSTSNNKAEKIDGVLMAPAKDMSDALGLTCMVEDDHISFRQDNIILKINFASPYVYKDGYIMDVLERSPVEVRGRAYAPLSFFTDYLQAKVEIKNNNEYYIKNDDFSLYDVVKFLPREVLGAIDEKNYPYGNKILKAVELPRSMNIEIPKINMEKVIDATSLDTFQYNFKRDLRNNGHSDEEIANYTYEDYRAIERSWKLPEISINFMKSTYPELKNENLSNWTYGDEEKYTKNMDTRNLGSRFTWEQRKQLSQRGIRLEDTFYLGKEFYQIDTILAQPDEVLKKTIEGYYQFSIDWMSASTKYDKGNEVK